MESIALVKYADDVGKTLNKGIELIGGFGVLRSPFIIKPNICTNMNRTEVTITDVEIVEALIKRVLKKDSGLSIKIVESDSQSKFADEAFERFGYKSLEKKIRNLGFDVTLVNLSKSFNVSVNLDGLYFTNLDLSPLLTGHRYFISMAVAETHGLTFVT